MKHKEVAVFCRKMSFMLDAGMQIKTAVNVIAEQSPARLKRALTVVDTYISRGDGVAAAFAAAGVFPAFLCGLMALGERTARLPEVAGQAADYYDELAETEHEMVSALAYPLLVSVLMFAVMVMAVTFVLPNYEQVFTASDVELPLITRVLLDISNFFQERGMMAAMAVLGVGILLFCYFKSAGGALLKNKLLLRLPLYRKYTNARFSQALALMLNTGQSAAGTLAVCAELPANSKVREDLHASALLVASGKPLWEALYGVKYIDDLLKEMIRVGEETGRLPQAVAKSRQYFQREYSVGVKRLNKLIEPALTIVLGAMIGVLMLAVILPTFRLADVGW